MPVIEQFVGLDAREDRISLIKMLFAKRQNLNTNSKDALVAVVSILLFVWMFHIKASFSADSASANPEKLEA